MGYTAHSSLVGCISITLLTITFHALSTFHAPVRHALDIDRFMYRQILDSLILMTIALWNAQGLLAAM